MQSMLDLCVFCGECEWILSGIDPTEIQTNDMKLHAIPTISIIGSVSCAALVPLGKFPGVLFGIAAGLFMAAAIKWNDGYKVRSRVTLAYVAIVLALHVVCQYTQITNLWMLSIVVGFCLLVHECHSEFHGQLPDVSSGWPFSLCGIPVTTEVDVEIDRRLCETAGIPYLLVCYRRPRQCQVELWINKVGPVCWQSSQGTTSVVASYQEWHDRAVVGLVHTIERTVKHALLPFDLRARPDGSDIAWRDMQAVPMDAYNRVRWRWPRRRAVVLAWNRHLEHPGSVANAWHELCPELMREIVLWL